MTRETGRLTAGLPLSLISLRLNAPVSPPVRQQTLTFPTLSASPEDDIDLPDLITSFLSLITLPQPSLNISTHSLRTHRSLLPGSMLTVANLLLWTLLTFCYHFQGTNQILVGYSVFLTPVDHLCHQAHPYP